MRVCVVYDCLYPYTVGGAERWYRALAERLATAGHDVTYLTMRQWPRGEQPDVAGVDVVAVGPRMQLYTGPRRRILPPLAFGLGVLTHLLRHGRRYEVVHTASFPYFSLLATAAARPLGRYRIFADWHEVWTKEYWRDYLGRLGGAAGWRVQRRCVRVRQRAFCFSRLHERRLREEGFRGEVTPLEGEGLVVVEASAAGTPSIVVRDPDNAATELVDDGENGFVVPSASPEELAAAIVRVDAAGEELRRSTAAWFRRNSRRLSLESSLEKVLAAYRAD